jgi:Ran GTPase-activating protein (RanGAP) involved in mRNA processing and transport
MSTCLLLSVPEDVLCSLAIPDCRVLMMARTCRSMLRALTARASPVHVTVREQVLTDSRLAEEFVAGMYRTQALFRIRRFECIVGFANSVQLKLCEFEDLTFLHLRHLKMHNNHLREPHLLNLLHMLTFSRDLRTFEFTQQTLFTRHVPVLADAIRCFPALEVLNVENNFLVFDTLGMVLDAVQSSTLSTVKLSSNRCEGIKQTLKLCRVIYSNCNCLRVLELSFMQLRNTAFESLAGAIRVCKLLESLDLSRNHLHCACLVAILEGTSGCPRLQSFNWSGNRLGSTGTFFIANHINNTDAWKSSMRSLKLRHCDVYNNMQQLTAALTSCTSLHTLDISGNAVMAHEVVALFQNMRIRSLDISDNHISDLGMRALLAHAMQSNMLHELHVDGNHLTAHSLRLLRKMRKTKGMKIIVPRASCFCDICHGP